MGLDEGVERGSSEQIEQVGEPIAGKRWREGRFAAMGEGSEDRLAG
jgi:hypothetical protein